MAIFDFLDRGGSMGDPFGGEGSLSGIRSEYNPETKEYKFFDEDDQQITDPERVKELTEKFTAEDDIDAGGTTSGIDSLDISKFTDILGDAVGAGKATPFRPVKGATAPAMPRMPQGSTSYRPTQSPYQVPSYLMSSAQYNEQISKMLGGLLARSIRSNPIKLLV
jgi:hypothetical protein